MYQPSMKARMDELERQKAEITARMADAPRDMPDVIRMLRRTTAAMSCASPKL